MRAYFRTTLCVSLFVSTRCHDKLVQLDLNAQLKCVTFSGKFLVTLPITWQDGLLKKGESLLAYRFCSLHPTCFIFGFVVIIELIVQSADLFLSLSRTSSFSFAFTPLVTLQVVIVTQYQSTAEAGAEP